MFQTFTAPSDVSNSTNRLSDLREQMQKENISAFLVPHADEHQNEYLPERAERLAWLTGFTGSAGFSIITLDQAVVFADGRYTVQLNEQIDKSAFSDESLIDTPPSKWLEANIKEGDIIAYDPWLITLNQLKTFEKAAQATKSKLQPIDNLIDRIWTDQPPEPMGIVALHDIRYAGKSASDKITEIQKIIIDKKCDFTVLTDPASLAWLFNIRGTDVVHNPLALGFAIIPTHEKPLIFMAEQKFNNKTTTALSKIANLHAPTELENKLIEVSRNKSALCDPNRVSIALADIIKSAGGTITHGRDPVVLPRAIKNEAEQNGTRNAHLRDGVAMVKFLYWLDAQPSNTISEIDAATKLEKIRTQNALDMNNTLKEISFDTISASGHHAALPHYRVNEDSNRILGEGEIYLVDSGGQYEDGTTDITRTIAIGTPSKEAITNFTLVLKGHITIVQAKFPKDTRGIDLDILARHALWQKGKDYAHGTGHGVGSYMNVHEGPQGIHRRAMEPLQPGMIISNEPGYYVEGEYGIRIENLVLVSQLQDIGGNIEVHTFENLTWAPIDKHLIDKSLLTSSEISWLNDYHSMVLEKISPHITGKTLKWLEVVTSKL